MHDERVVAMHPQGGMLVGWGDVGAAEQGWPERLKTWVYKNIQLLDMTIEVQGNVAWAVFTERVDLHVPGRDPLPMEVRVSNVYERHGSEWLIIMHHDSITDLDVLHKLQELQ